MATLTPRGRLERLLGLAAGLSLASLLGAQTITEFPVLTNQSDLGLITAGPDGALWFTEQTARKIGRITTAGVVTEFSVAPSTNPFGIATGPDGALWFTEDDKIGRITTTGGISEFLVPTPNSIPDGIVAGSDGALWFSEAGGNRIGRITTSGTITEFPLPSALSTPTGITAGPDGAFWFCESDGNRIGRITTAGVITEFPLPGAGRTPYSIIPGADGALWFTENDGNRIGRITTAGVISEFAVPTPSSFPFDIAAGSDGALWFTEDSGNKVGRITPAGALSEFVVPTGGSEPAGIAAGPDGSLWFTEFTGNRIGRVGLAPTSCTPDAATLCLNNGRFKVQTRWTTRDGQTGSGQAVALTGDTGYFWFFSATNVEMVVKVLNACGFNSRFWTFAGGLTDVNVVLTVTDTRAGSVKTYINPQGTPFQPIQDTSAFATCSLNDGASVNVAGESSEARAGASVRPERRAGRRGFRPRPAALQSLASEGAACVADATSLCLNGGRFKVQAQWTARDGSSGTGQAIALTSDTGYFWFFSANNVEMVVKVLNACGFNSRFWTFAGGLTDVNVVLTITDTQAGTVKTYTNPQGTAFQPIQDTSAFATCP